MDYSIIVSLKFAVLYVWCVCNDASSPYNLNILLLKLIYSLNTFYFNNIATIT